MDPFEFRRCLYDLSKQLSRSDLNTMKFICDDALARRQLEKINSCFMLFSWLEHAQKLSATDLTFLEELLDVINRTHLLEPLRRRGAGRPFTETVNSNRGEGRREEPMEEATPTTTTPTEHCKQEFRKLLTRIGNRLSNAEVRNLASFFVSPVSGLTLEEFEEEFTKGSPALLFEALVRYSVVTFTDLQSLYLALETIGRKDLCSDIHEYITKSTKPAEQTATGGEEEEEQSNPGEPRPLAQPEEEAEMEEQGARHREVLIQQHHPQEQVQPEDTNSEKHYVFNNYR